MGVTRPHLECPLERDERLIGDIGGEQRRCGKAAVVLELRDGGRQVQSHRDADGGLEGARDDDRECGIPNDAQRRRHTAERLGLDHEDVGGARPRDLQRVLGFAHALVGGDRHAQVPHAVAQLGEFGDARARLLGVLEVVLGEGVDRALGLVHVPGAVRVDPDAPLRPEDRAHRRDPLEIVGEALPGLGDLDLDGAASREPREHGRHVAELDRGQRRVHPHALAQQRVLGAPAEVDRSREPRRGLLVGVLGERGELGPAVGAFDEHRLANHDAAEAGGQREGDDASAREQVFEGGEHVPSLASSRRLG